MTMNMMALYNTIKELQSDLRFDIQSHTQLNDASHEIKALAACYELQDYLANRITEECSEVEEEMVERKAAAQSLFGILPPEVGDID